MHRFAVASAPARLLHARPPTSSISSIGSSAVAHRPQPLVPSPSSSSALHRRITTFVDHRVAAALRSLTCQSTLSTRSNLSTFHHNARALYIGSRSSIESIIASDDRLQSDLPQRRSAPAEQCWAVIFVDGLQQEEYDKQAADFVGGLKAQLGSLGSSTDSTPVAAMLRYWPSGAAADKPSVGALHIALPREVHPEDVRLTLQYVSQLHSVSVTVRTAGVLTDGSHFHAPLSYGAGTLRPASGYMPQDEVTAADSKHRATGFLQDLRSTTSHPGDAPKHSTTRCDSRTKDYAPARVTAVTCTPRTTALEDHLRIRLHRNVDYTEMRSTEHEIAECVKAAAAEAGVTCYLHGLRTWRKTTATRISEDVHWYSEANLNELSKAAPEVKQRLFEGILRIEDVSEVRETMYRIDGGGREWAADLSACAWRSGSGKPVAIERSYTHNNAYGYYDEFDFYTEQPDPTTPACELLGPALLSIPISVELKDGLSSAQHAATTKGLDERMGDLYPHRAQRDNTYDAAGEAGGEAGVYCYIGKRGLSTRQAHKILAAVEGVKSIEHSNIPRLAFDIGLNDTAYPC
ncbi:hypothetical protein LTR36_003368 [Oleoguttula mirabilis]|uniref:Uncharacterized protein n=1 Tax=Oleoguttula mirabilis TaxID=1507867 RepID=A0AAV9JIE9_9PEZI|nr:hypothetical protein LTR36_003368 [Oleoguttula mirabilis]